MRKTHFAQWTVVVAVVFAFAPAAPAFAKGYPVEPGRATPDDFFAAQACTCHGALVDEWSLSMHSKALTDPIYNAKVEEANEATDGKIGPFCRKCHAPAATMTGEIASGKITGAGSSQGVGCMFCHQVTGMQEGTPANTSQLVTLDGTRRAQIQDPQAPHPAAYSELHSKAEICGGCHNVDHPVNGMHLEATYSEWLESPYADEGVVCQDCHMSQQVGQRGPSRGEAAVGAPTRDNIYHMTFIGAQVALGNPEQATALLKSAAEIEIEAPEVVSAGDSGEVQVKISNVGAGHYLPTGLTEVRQMWLEVTAENPDGSTTKIGERRFGTILKDKDGNAPVELWDATGIDSDDRIPPRGSVTATYTVTMPTAAEKSTLSAALYYKSVPDELAQKAATENPTTRMASASVPIFASQAARDAAAQDDEPATAFRFSPWFVALAAAGFGVLLAIAYLVARRRRHA